jgi:hypothetical protein
VQAVVYGRFDCIQKIASLLAALNKYRPSLVVAAVDMLIEDLILSLTSPHAYAPQTCLARAQLFAQLYNYTVIQTSHLFNMLYLLILSGSFPSPGVI